MKTTIVVKLTQSHFRNKMEGYYNCFELFLGCTSVLWTDWCAFEHSEIKDDM